MKHRRTDVPANLPFDVQNDARCTCIGRHFVLCARHGADAYADQMARHATDSLPPTMPSPHRAEAFHSFGITR